MAVRSKKRKSEHVAPEGDKCFAFIAGYTAGDVPYGVTWEELEKNEDRATALQPEPPPMQGSPLEHFPADAGKPDMAGNRLQELHCRRDTDVLLFH